jgi:small-conductance mechanosensitive channel
MNDLLASASRFLTADRILLLVRVAAILVVGLLLARLVGAGIARLAARRLGVQQIWIARRLGRYTITILVLMTALRELGFNLNILLGAAGILTVAVGFASQTSASNLISGLFLVAERPFVVGDVIRVGDVTGEVIAIDLLSVKLRTFDNLFVRVPNESLIKSQITNLTHFPIRRIDMPIGISYGADIARTRELLLALVDDVPLCLQEPAPVCMVTGYGDSAINLQLSVWVKREQFVELRTALYEEIKQAFDREGIEIPIPQRMVHLRTGRDEPPAGGPPQG